MIVIADASPLNYLVLIEEAEILARLYGQVVIPLAVLRELQHPETPALVAKWIADRPAWLEVRQAGVAPDSGLEALGDGEREAIAFAQQHGAEALLLMDEGRGRKEASRRHIRTTGTLGVLNDAAARGWVDLPSAIQRLRKTTFRISDNLLQTFLERDAERKRRT